MKRIIKHQHIITSLILVLFFSCSTEKNTLTTRSFHNLTSHYNVYFNGNEAIKSYMLRIEDLPEDYTSILPVYKESVPEARGMVGSDMLTAIEKADKLIKFHSITKPPKKKKGSKKKTPAKHEYNNWVDDAYIMKGKANLYSGDYLQAENIFSQVLHLYKDEPQKYVAYIWMIRTYSESERYTEAGELVSSLEGDDKFPSELGGELAIAAADLFLKQSRFDEAIKYINIGIKKIKGNKRKTRYTFILAQLYREINQNDKALTAFQQVIRRRPSYEMSFNARIMSAQVLSGNENNALLRKELNKMKRNKRNEPYLDQIYYALGNIFTSEGKSNQAIDHYKLSVAKSVKNTHQRALSAITLGEIFFNQKSYELSAAYYDSAFAVMNEEYPNYEQLNKRYQNLSQLVDYLSTVKIQDSLQYLSKLSKEELDAKIQYWIGQATAEQAKMNAKEAGQSGSMMYANQSNRLRSSSSDFYFYNPSTVAFGKKEFQRLWGDRKNEDNWRRKNKAVVIEEETTKEETANLKEEIEEVVDEKESDPTKKEYYTKDIPVTDSLLKASHLNIRDALFNAGGLFKTEFDDEFSSIKCYQELNRRYPNNIYNDQSLFYLWDLYTAIQKPDSASIYKNQIMSLYPESNYAKFLINPNYFTELEAQRDSLNRMYTKAFNAYKTGNYNTAAGLSRQIATQTADTLLRQKAQFIAMISQSRSLPQGRFADSLQVYIAKYPAAETTELAKDILKLLKEETLTNYQSLVASGYINEKIQNTEVLASNQTEQQVAQSKWAQDSKLLHYFVIAFPNDNSIDINRLKFDIANYNLDHYTSLDFEIETETLNNETKLIVVRHLDSKENALIYFLSIIRKPEVFKTLAGQKFYNFVISNSNFREIMNDQNFEEYLQFFVKNYSKFTTGEFPEDAYESPEAMMAKLKAQQNELKEKGEFVVVSKPDSAYVPPVNPVNQLFDTDYNSPHEFIVYIPQTGYQTGFLMRSFMQTNNKVHREKRLKVMPAVLKTGPILSVSTFANAATATEYAQWANESKNLFAPLGNTPYKTFVISSANYLKLKNNNEIDAYQKYYQQAYVQNRKAIMAEKEPKAEIITPEPEKKQETKPTTVDKEDVKTETTSIPTKNTATETKVETKPEEKSKASTTESTTQQVPENIEVAPSIEKPYDGPYTSNTNEKQIVVIIVPSQGFNKMILLTNVNRFNTMRYRNNNLQTTMEELSSNMNMMEIATGDTTLSKTYLKELMSDPRLSQSLRNVIHKAFVISESNLNTLKTLKNPTQYEEFYNRFY